jgi:hypothetical protein
MELSFKHDKKRDTWTLRIVEPVERSEMAENMTEEYIGHLYFQSCLMGAIAAYACMMRDTMDLTQEEVRTRTGALVHFALEKALKSEAQKKLDALKGH